MYKYELINNHYIVCINDKHYLIDTGSPNSLSMNNYLQTLNINNKNYHLVSAINRIDLNAVKECVGILPDGFIGMDIISDNSLTIYKDGYLDFSCKDIDKANVVPMSGPFPSIEITLNSIKGKMIIDTGAKYGYIQKSLLGELIPFERVQDYNPILGHLESDNYHQFIDINGTKKFIDVCSNEKVTNFCLKPMNALMINNITALFDEVCVFDMKKHLFIFK